MGKLRTAALYQSLFHMHMCVSINTHKHTPRHTYSIHLHTHTRIHSYTTQTTTKLLNKIKIKVYELDMIIQGFITAKTGGEKLEARVGYTRSCLKKLKLNK